MATGKEWDEYFSGLTPEAINDLRKAISALERDPMIRKEFKDIGLFTLDYFLLTALEHK